MRPRSSSFALATATVLFAACASAPPPSPPPAPPAPATPATPPATAAAPAAPAAPPPAALAAAPEPAPAPAEPPPAPAAEAKPAEPPKPEVKVSKGEAVYYDANARGSCSLTFGRDAAVLSAPNAVYNQIQACGQCLEITGSEGSEVVMVADRCNDCPPDRLVINKPAFVKIARSARPR